MKTTALHAAHRRMGARMVPFAGYEMPIQYTSIVAEHLSVRQQSGLFDVSHMGQFWVQGTQAQAFLQAITVNDLGKLKVGRAQYSMLPNERGGLLDDIYVYRVAETEYLVVVNAANRDRDWDHLVQQSAAYDLQWHDDSDHTALLALQGPQAAALLQPMLQLDLNQVRKNDTLTAQLGEWPVRLARTGYTGEDGFEIFVAADQAEALWDSLVQAGALPCGLGARDTLRLEAGYPLYGHELTEETNPLCTPLAWAVKLTKEFFGKQALLAATCSQSLVGLLLEQGIPREGYAVLYQGQVVGRVTSGTQSPSLKKGIALAYVNREWSALGSELAVEIRGQAQPAVVVTLPFVSGQMVAK